MANNVEGADQLGDELTMLAETVYGMSTDSNSAPIKPTTVVFPLARSRMRSEFVLRLTKDKTRRIHSPELIAVLAAIEELASVAQTPSPNGFVQKLESSDASNAVLEIAHDMRSPLSAILFLVETLRGGQSGPVTPVQERQLGLVYGAALGLSGLASDIIEATRGNLMSDEEPQPLSVAATIQDVCSIVAPVAEEKKLDLQQTYIHTDVRLGYATALHRVLLNLTNNALKYTPRGSVSVGATDFGDGRIEFWVEDTGRGIPDHVIAMLFTEFRPGASGMRFSSAGLGLVICRSLLAKMSSTLRVDTAAEQGTRFSFVLDMPPA